MSRPLAAPFVLTATVPAPAPPPPPPEEQLVALSLNDDYVTTPDSDDETILEEDNRAPSPTKRDRAASEDFWDADHVPREWEATPKTPKTPTKRARKVYCCRKCGQPKRGHVCSARGSRIRPAPRTAAPPAPAPPPPKKRGRATTGSAAAKKPAEREGKRRKGTDDEVQRSTAQVSQSLDRDEDDAQPTLPVIAMPPSSIKPDGVCELLLETILFHEHVPNTIHRGNIGEVIFAMIATKIFNCSWSDVEIVGAHAAHETRSGPGDDGRDIIICGNPPRNVDFKAWSKNGRNIGAKDARSIGGALGAMEITDEGGIGIVATNHDFTANAVRYRDDFNNYSKDSRNMNVELWNGGKLKDKIKSAIKKWPSQSSGFITDVLCYLDHENLIELRYPNGQIEKRESQRDLAQRAGVTNLKSLFKPPSLEKPSRKRNSSQRDDD